MKHKHLKVTEETHNLIKQQAKANGMFIDAYIQHLINKASK